MAIKTVLRNLLGKYGYLTVSLQEGIATDAQSDTDEKQVIVADAQAVEVVDDANVEYEEVGNAPQIEDNTEEKEPDPGF